METWALRFVPGLILGFTIKTCLDAVKKDNKARAPVNAKPRKKIVASKAAAAAVAAATRSNVEYKMVLCVNESLKMGKGKIAAQCAHAAVGVVEEHKEYSRGEFEAWELRGHAKVALRVPTEDEMMKLAQQAEDQDMFTYLVVDAGRTQIAAGSRTVLAIGPAPKPMIDKITGHLKLL
mmetsp:Transcript_18960/g.57276  ORF Transcript_18960/g.57276 Transcript_18960/m.57276 type:complete len:178 (+) Transcript_18960:103-636(+)